jgi:hypothetical protein
MNPEQIKSDRLSLLKDMYLYHIPKRIIRKTLSSRKDCIVPREFDFLNEESDDEEIIITRQLQKVGAI